MYLVCLGCHDQTSQTMWLKQQKLTVTQFRKRKIQDSKSLQDWEDGLGSRALAVKVGVLAFGSTAHMEKKSNLAV